VAPGAAVKIANPIYREVITRVLGSIVERQITLEPQTFVRADGTFDVDKMLTEFTSFWLEHGEIMALSMSYKSLFVHDVFGAGCRCRALEPVLEHGQVVAGENFCANVVAHRDLARR